MSKNMLSKQTSPYLIQHKDNPVHWVPWGADAFERAKAENKPILISIGYSACHWCHVMAHESFEDPDTAQLMNRYYINVKIDREERPDLDQLYQSALSLMGHHGGWPLTMFLTPNGEPFYGGTYFPVEAKYGRPGFKDVLSRIAQVYHTEGKTVEHNAAAVKKALEQHYTPQNLGPVSLEILDTVLDQLYAHTDKKNGGLKGAPKFPQFPILEFLWRGWRRTNNKKYRTAVIKSLTHICQGGIYDHLGGGMARYSVDEEWLVPHFEKMLYDNAALIELLTLVWQETNSDLFKTRAYETIGWAVRDLLDDKTGAFMAALDADSDGEEGKYYVWSSDEIDKLLDSKSTVFKRYYGITKKGNWEGKNILNRLKSPDEFDLINDEKIAPLREKIMLARNKRVKPGLDDKILADWNGLMITALAKASRSFDEPEWLDIAEKCFAFVKDKMSNDGLFVHSYCKGKKGATGHLDDYAQMCKAALCLYEITSNIDYLQQAQKWCTDLTLQYWDSENGGYFLSPEQNSDIIMRPKTVVDSATPSGNAVMIGVLSRLFHLTGEPAYHERMEKNIQIFSGAILKSPLGVGSLLNNTEFAHRATHITIIGSKTDSETIKMTKLACAGGDPNRIMSFAQKISDLPPGHPAKQAKQPNVDPIAYICQDFHCEAVAKSAAEFEKKIA